MLRIITLLVFFPKILIGLQFQEYFSSVRGHKRTILLLKEHNQLPGKLEDGLVDDWHTLAQRNRVSERIKKLERGNSDMSNVLKSDRIDEKAIANDWIRLEAECSLYMNQDELKIVHDALIVAHAAHYGQKRRSGEAFVSHPVAVAFILAQLQMDVETVAAGLLHDTVEDTDVTFDQLDGRFGSGVRRIVEGETKVSKLPKLARRAVVKKSIRNVLDSGTAALMSPPPRHDMKSNGITSSNENDAFSIGEEQAENLRQMLVAMTDDYRIIVVKLADRLHNMQTLGAMPREKQIKISRETLEIFAPLAHRLGIWSLKKELEDLAFMYAHPEEYQALTAALELRASRHRHALQATKRDIERTLQAVHSACEKEEEEEIARVAKCCQVRTECKFKHLYALWLKLRKLAAEEIGTCENAQFNVDAIDDLLAIEVVLKHDHDDDQELCYAALKVLQTQLHGAVPVPSLGVKDYIAVPKPNGYQSLHFFVQRPNGQLIEIQIRTDRMHTLAEKGRVAQTTTILKNTNSPFRIGGDITKRSVQTPVGWGLGTLPLSSVPAAAFATAHTVTNLDDHHQQSAEDLATNQYDTDEGTTVENDTFAVSWLGALKTWQHEIPSSREFIDTVRRELLGKRVFVFLRDGKILDLSRGATVLDAAFQIHTDVGLHASGALINGQPVQFSYVLQNGDVVSITTSPDAKPQPDWMRWATRRSTRTKLRSYFKAQQKRAASDKDRAALFSQHMNGLNYTSFGCEPSPA